MYLYCKKTYKKNNRSRKKVVNGGQEGMLENSITLANIVGEGTET